MRINLEMLDLRAFLAVFDFGSFKEAAELLKLTQPALSRRIQALESRLGVALLERSTRHVVPTLAGRKLEPIARRLLDELDLADGVPHLGHRRTPQRPSLRRCTHSARDADQGSASELT